MTIDIFGITSNTKVSINGVNPSDVKVADFGSPTGSGTIAVNFNPDPHSLGPLNVVVTDGPYTAPQTPTVSFRSNLGILPSSGSTLGGAPFTISGCGLANPNLYATFGPNGAPSTGNSPTSDGKQAAVNTPTRLSAGATAGTPVDVVVYYPGLGPATFKGAFTYMLATPPALSITSSAIGSVGIPYTLTAANAGGATPSPSGALTYQITSGSGTVCSVSGAALTFIATGHCIVTATRSADPDYVSSTSAPFDINVQTGSPIISSVTPGSGSYKGGNSVTISGSGFDSVLANNVVMFGDNPAPVTSASSTSLTVTAPASTTGAGAVNVTVKNSLGTSKASTYSYALLSVISLSSGGDGQGDGGFTITGYSCAETFDLKIAGTGFTANTQVSIPGVSLSLRNANIAESTLEYYGTLNAPPSNPGPLNVVVKDGSDTAPQAATISFVEGVSSISPSSGSTLGGTPITINGCFFSQSGMSALFGQLAASSTGDKTTQDAKQAVVNTPTRAIAGATAGTPVDVVVKDTVSGQLRTFFRAFTYMLATPPALSITSSAIGSVGVPYTLTATNAGSATPSPSGALTYQITSGSGTVCSVSGAALTFNAAGICTVTATRSADADYAASTSAPFDINVAVPLAISSVSPSSGIPHTKTTITLTGTGFGTTTNTQVSYGTTGRESTCAVGSVTSTQIMCTVSTDIALNQSVKFIATVSGVASAASTATFTAVPPTILSISPPQWPAGTPGTVYLYGVGLGTSAADIQSVVYKHANGNIASCASPTWISATTIKCQIGSDLAKNEAVTFQITTASGGQGAFSTATLLGVLPGTGLPTIYSITPAAGPLTGGTNISITGSGFLGATGITIGGNGVQVTGIIDSLINAVTPQGSRPGPASVIVTNVGGSNTDNTMFNYVPAPQVSKVSPAAGPAAGGTMVTLTGSGFALTSNVTIGGKKVSYTVDTDGQISIVTPGGPETVVSIVVTTPGGVDNASVFKYVGGVKITNIDKVTGPSTGGTSVNISGTGFTTDGSTTVAFGAYPAQSVVVNSTTSITATSPAGLAGTSVPLVVNTPGGSDSSTQQFTYTPVKPTITSITPSQGALIGGTNVTIKGAGFLGTTSVSIGGTVQKLSFVSDTLITAITAAHAAGTVDVVVSGGLNGTGTGVGQFTYAAPAPSNLPVGIITLVAGKGVPGNTGENGPATEALLQNPNGVAVDGKGNVYIADTNNNLIRKVDYSKDAGGIISTVAGGGVGFTENFPATKVGLFAPSGVAVDGNGYLYIADKASHTIRKVDFSSGNGIISTVAGENTNLGYNGDNIPATEALLASPSGVAVDKNNNLYIADSGNNRIRKVDFSSGKGMITTVAGGGTPLAGVGDNGPATAASLSGPSGVAVDKINNLYIVDSGNFTIRKVDYSKGAGGTISTIAGISGQPAFNYPFSDGALATSAPLTGSSNVAVDGSGNVYLTLAGIASVSKVSPSGSISTFAGKPGNFGYSGNNGPATAALLSFPTGVAVDGSDNLYIAEYGNSTIRKVTTVQPPFYPAGTNVAMQVALTATVGSTTYSFADTDCSGIFLYTNPDISGAKLAVTVNPFTCSKGGETISFGPSGALAIASGNLSGSLGGGVNFSGSYDGTNSWSGAVSGADSNQVAYTGTLTLTVPQAAIQSDLSWLTQGGSFSFSTPFQTNIKIDALGLNAPVTSTVQASGQWLLTPKADASSGTINYSGSACGSFNLSPPLTIPATPPSLPLSVSVAISSTWTGTLIGTSTANNLTFTGTWTPTVTASGAGGAGAQTSKPLSQSYKVTLNLPLNPATGSVPAIIPSFTGTLTPSIAGAGSVAVPVNFPDSTKTPPVVPLTVSSSGATISALNCPTN